MLGLLSYRESTGYELTKMFEHSLNNFWHAQSSQIYRELNRIEKLGWASSESIIQDGRPNKRLYTITDAGREELAQWLREAKTGFDNYHHAILLRIFFGADNPESTLELLRECAGECACALESYERSVPQVIRTYAELIPDGEKRSKFWSMTLDYGLAQTRAALDWARRCIALIEEDMDK